MRRDTRVQLIALGTMLVFVLASGVLALQVTGSSARHKLVYSDRAEEGDPPQVALGIAMGAFRGLFVNFLWIRANELKEQGRYYEAIDLASTITKLQPRFPRVWTFHAWNMAYNISVTTQTLPERWSWVQAGVKLLRDEGIPANPNDMLLHKELAWIFLHKIAGWTDDANQYYKAEHAGEWTIVLGEPPAPSPETRRDRDAAKAAYADWLSAIADAPSSLDDVIAGEPRVRDLLVRLRTEAEAEPGFELLRRYQRQVAIDKRGGSLIFGDLRYTPRAEAFKSLFEDPEYADAWAALIPHVRKRVLIDTYHMEPERMVRYTRKYGPIDWRWPSAHALYWSVRGVERGLVRQYEGNARDFDFLNTDRIVMQSVQDLYRYGDLYFDFYSWVTQPDGSPVTFVRGPNIHFIPAYKEILDEIIERGGFFENPEERIFTAVGMGYENFMKDAIRHYYRAGFVEEAERMRDELMTWRGRNANDPTSDYKYSLPIDEWVVEELKERIGSPNVALSEIQGALMAAFNFGLLAGDDERFRSEIAYASRFHREFMGQQYRQTLGDQFRMGMVSDNFRLLSGVYFAQFLQTITPEDAKRVYLVAPDDLKRWGYDVLVGMYKQAIDENTDTPTFDETFPEPSGMAQFRAERERIMEEQQELQSMRGAESQ